MSHATPGNASQVARLVLRDITKRFGGVRAIRHADFELLPGEVHALIGENGAGKSTLIKIIAGAETPDTGTMEMDGHEVSFGSASAAIDRGVATVYQEAQLFKQLTVAENIFIGRELRKGRRVDWASQNAAVVELLGRLGLPARLSTQRVGELSAAEAQQVSIVKALASNVRVLILDEPSAILTDAEIEVLFAAIRRLQEQGVSIIYISHRLDELLRIADRISVMRDGETIGTYPAKDLSIQMMAELMVGGQLNETARIDRTPGEVRLAFDAATSGEDFHDVSLTVRSGETVVLYGLIGSGVLEIAEAVYGMRRLTKGAMTLNGHAYTPRSPRDAQASGVGMLPANRRREGMFGFQPIRFNISVGHLRLLSHSGGAWMNLRRERSTVKDMIHQLSIKTPSGEVPINAMSGGNAQKVVLARQLVERPGVLVLAEPTQGVDVGAKEEIHSIIGSLTDDGAAILVATSDLGEAIRIADRLIVIRDGTNFTEFGPDAAQSDVLAAASGQLSTSQQAMLQEGGDHAGQ